MSRKNQIRQKNSPVYWQTDAYNTQLYLALRDVVESMALTRFEYTGLPDTCDPLYLEYQLLYKGLATFARSKKTGIWYTLQAVPNGTISVYGRPTAWEALGANGMRFEVTPHNGVLVWDNMTERPLMSLLSIYVRELVDIWRTRQINRMHQKVPFVIKGAQEKQIDMTNLVRQVAGGEPWIITTRGYDAMDIEVLGGTAHLNMPYIGEELDASERNVWNDIYRALGVTNIAYKAERMVADEVRSQEEPTELRALDPLTRRRMAFDAANRRFGTNVQVNWRHDWQSANFELQHNMQKLLEIGGDE